MNPQTRIRLTLAAMSGLIAVAAGAFGAHGLADLRAKELMRTGAEYQLIHALAVFACFAIWECGGRAAGIAAWCFLAGATLFSGSLYVIALTGERWTGPITPIGGLLLLAGWATLAWAAAMAKRRAPNA